MIRAKLERFTAEVREFQKVSMIFQKGGDEQADLSDVCFLFDSIVQKFPSTRYHLEADADIIINKTFENVKVHGGFEEHLS